MSSPVISVFVQQNFLHHWVASSMVNTCPFNGKEPYEVVRHDDNIHSMVANELSPNAIKSSMQVEVFMFLFLLDSLTLN